MAEDTPPAAPRKRTRKPAEPSNVVPITSTPTERAKRTRPIPGRKASPRTISVAERRAEALNLRRAGLSYERIAELIRSERHQNGYSRASAYRDVREGLDRLIEEPARELLEDELARLLAMQTAFWGPAMRGDVPSGKIILDIMRQRARYVGLESPVKHQLTGPTGEGAVAVIDLSDAGQVKDAAWEEMNRLLAERQQRAAAAVDG